MNKADMMEVSKLKNNEKQEEIMNQLESSNEFINLQPHGIEITEHEMIENSSLKLQLSEKRKISEQEGESDMEQTVVGLEIKEQSPEVRSEQPIKRCKADENGTLTVNCEDVRASKTSFQANQPLDSNPIAGPSSAMDVEATVNDCNTDETFLGPCHHGSAWFVDGKCSLPCGAQLECGDMCSGTCGSCFKSKIHQLCSDPCGKELICGHMCESLCKDYCPPCLKPCPVFCPHAPCPSKCSEPCPPCEKPCCWKCAHLSCSRKCGEDCDRPLCNERCPRKLTCGHDCVGICGELCPPCRTCRPEKFPQVFQTEEEEDDPEGRPRSRYILLMCEHAIEVTGLIKYWSLPESQDDENAGKKEHQQVSMAKCPACRKVQTCRYLPTVRLTLQLIQLGKKELWWNRVDGIERDLTTTIYAIRSELDRQSLNPAFTGGIMQFLDAKMIDLNAQKSGKGRRTNNSMSVHLFKMKCLQKMILTLLKFWKAYDDQVRNTLRENMTRLLNAMGQFKNPERFGKQQFSDFTNETYRFCHLAQFQYLVLHSGYYNNKNRDDIKQLYEKIKNRLNCSNRYTVAMSKENELDLEKLRETVKAAPLITEDEKNMLYSVFPELKNFLYFNRGQGYLYKCPEGHVYFIGDCGQAQTASVCNLCNGKIGGEHHKLLHGSAYHLDQFENQRSKQYTLRGHEDRQQNFSREEWVHHLRTWNLRRQRTRVSNLGPAPHSMARYSFETREGTGDQMTGEGTGDQMTGDWTGDQMMRLSTRVPSKIYKKLLRKSLNCEDAPQNLDGGRRLAVAELSTRMYRMMDAQRDLRRRQDIAMEQMYKDLVHQINTASEDDIKKIWTNLVKPSADEMSARCQCFGCMAHAMIPEGVRLTNPSAYEVITASHCTCRSGGNGPRQVATTLNNVSSPKQTLEKLKEEILKGVAAKLDTLKPYFNQMQDLEQPGPSGMASVASSNLAAARPHPQPAPDLVPTPIPSSSQPIPATGSTSADSGESMASFSAPANANGLSQMIYEPDEDMSDVDWTWTVADEEVVCIPSDSD